MIAGREIWIILAVGGWICSLGLAWMIGVYDAARWTRDKEEKNDRKKDLR